MSLLILVVLVSGDIIRADITGYSEKFRHQLKDAQRAFQAEQWGGGTPFVSRA